jgi:hypothetical protein
MTTDAGHRPGIYLLARKRGGSSWEALRACNDILAAADLAITLSEAEPRAVYRVLADGVRTVLLATAGRGHWVRIARD